MINGTIIHLSRAERRVCSWMTTQIAAEVGSINFISDSKTRRFWGESRRAIMPQSNFLSWKREQLKIRRWKCEHVALHTCRVEGRFIFIVIYYEILDTKTCLWVRKRMRSAHFKLLHCQVCCSFRITRISEVFRFINFSTFVQSIILFQCKSCLQAWSMSLVENHFIS